MFVALGMTATGLGETLGENRETLRQVSGVMLIADGRLLHRHALPAAAEPRVAPRGAHAACRTGGPVVAGLAFAVAWLPCTGPTLGAILTAAANEDTVGEGGVLLAFYALGLAVPFLLSAVAFTSVTRSSASSATTTR